MKRIVKRARSATTASTKTRAKRAIATVSRKVAKAKTKLKAGVKTKAKRAAKSHNLLEDVRDKAVSMVRATE